jgi:hypothetical protein
MTDDATPPAWRKTDQPDDEMTRYSPQPVTQYEHVEVNVGVQLVPTDPQTGNASEDGYRINVLSDSMDSSGNVDLLTNASDHRAALGVAREFMQAYDDQCVEGNEDLDTIMQEFSGPN